MAEDVSKKKLIKKKVPVNIIATAVIALLIGFGLSIGFGCNISGAFVNRQSIGDKVISYMNTNILPRYGASAELISVNETGNSLYSVNMLIKGEEGSQPTSVFVTKDGNYLIPVSEQYLVDLNEKLEQPAQEQTPQDISKQDRPDVELYIFSYCPAGIATLDSFSEVADLLKDDVNFKVKFFSHMHGEHEHQQNMIQECIQKVSPDKYWNYAKQYLEEIYQVCGSSRSIDCDKNQSVVLMTSVGINSDDVMDCVEKNGETYYQQDIEDATNLQLRYSPSFVINGEYLENVDRSPEGIKSVVCSGFVTKPDECSQTLSASSSGSTGGCT